MTPGRRMAFRLALALGQPNPDVMLRNMPHRIWLEWLLYAQYEPFGMERGDYQAGVVASAIANTDAGGRIYQPGDFMPKFAEPSPPTPEDHLKSTIRLTKMMGGNIIYKSAKDDAS